MDIRTVPPYPNASFAVIADPHIYDPSLGSSGFAFEKVMESDRKLLLDGIELLNCAIDLIIASGVAFVLIPGDLSKDGEQQNHRLLAEKLSKLRTAGIAVYLIPGNHDINNHNSVSYENDITVPVSQTSPEDFLEIYDDFGFKTAIMRDNNSLSYVAEPAPGLWLLAIDGCCYRENDPEKHHIVGGRVGAKTMNWITGVLETADRENKAVMAIIHHGVVEHWKGQARLNPEFLIDDYINFGNFLAKRNVRIVFTGHYHAQSISRGDFGGHFLYDVQSGSLIGPPCPIRFVEIKNSFMHIRTETIIDKIHPGTNFASEAQIFIKRNYALEAASYLKKLRVSKKDTEYIALAVAEAFTAFCAGDENLAQCPPFDRKKLGLWGRIVYSRFKYVLDGLWENLPPGDNNVSIEL